MHLGIREKMSDEELIINMNFLKESYPNITLEDVRLAIKYSLNGTLGMNPETFGSFSPLYISKVINAYLIYKREEMIAIESRKNYHDFIHKKEPELTYAEKVWEKIVPHETENLAEQLAELNNSEHEQNMVKGAVRTDFILSAEIMAIAPNEVKSLAETSIWLEAGTLAFVAVAITIAVYGVVGLIVKMDDIGLHMAGKENGASQAIGRFLVQGMPKLLTALSTVGTAAMLWVGGQIVVHGFGLHPAAFLGLHEGALAWVVDAALCGIAGLAIGAMIVLVHHMVAKRKAH